jgi:hypothetical protein
MQLMFDLLMLLTEVRVQEKLEKERAEAARQAALAEKAKVMIHFND